MLFTAVMNIFITNIVASILVIKIIIIYSQYGLVLIYDCFVFLGCRRNK
jgi:hypothetical protein